MNILVTHHNEVVWTAGKGKGYMKGYPQEEGPIIGGVDETLKEFHVARQAYYGGTFIGNHEHRSVKVVHDPFTQSATLSITKSLWKPSKN